MKLVVGLGNPGEKYTNTLHNIGYRVVDSFSGKSNNQSFHEKSKFSSFIAEMRVNNEKILIVKPQTYMNKSGVAVSELTKYFNIVLEDVLVIHDDIALELGKIRLRIGGSSGGHNGIKSIIEQCGKGFWRLRVGVGGPPNNLDASDYVLSRFNDTDNKRVREIVESSHELIYNFLDETIEPTSITIDE